MTQQPSTGDRDYYHYLDYFRAFAILGVVAVHSWGPITALSGGFGQPPTDSAKVMLAISGAFFHNSTIYFAVISGLLFSLILKRYSWRKFYTKKFKDVFIPFAIISVPYLFYSKQIFIPAQVPAMATLDVIKSIPLSLATGSAFGQLWYIPILIMLFMLTPLFQWLANRRSLWPIILLLLIMPLFVTRVWPEFSFKNLAYFIGPYLGGMILGTYHDDLMPRIREYRRLLWGVMLSTSGVLLYLYYQKIPEFHGVSFQESIGYIQKMCLSVLILDLLRQFESRISPKLKIFANYAFSIYFIHMFFSLTLSVKIVVAGLTKEANSMMIFVYGGIVFILSLSLSMGITWIVKKLTGQYSRMLIGA